jgi:predicted nuclease of predicted toxin-antitoxin system
MKFFIDANLPYSSKEIFEKFGKVWHAKDVKLQAAADKIIFKFAVKKKAILVTRDLEFANPYLYPKKSHYGVLILKVPFWFTANQINKTIKSALSSIEIKILEKAVVVIEPAKIRIRK